LQETRSVAFNSGRPTKRKAALERPLTPVSFTQSGSRERTVVLLSLAIAHEREASEADQHHRPGRGFRCSRRSPVNSHIIQPNVLVAFLTLNGNQGGSRGGGEVQREASPLIAYAGRIIRPENLDVEPADAVTEMGPL
jgi:hypothetical protein